jgi:uncharacterized protein (DUF983 family)
MIFVMSKDSIQDPPGDKVNISKKAKVTGECECGEGKLLRLLFIERKLHRRCLTCGETVNLEE